jgi:hypothetical protein
MSPVGIRRLRRLSMLCLSGVALLLEGCHYTEEEKWSVCCVLHVGAYDAATPGARTVINWYRSIVFDGDGQGGQGPYETLFSNKDDKVRSEVAAFLGDNPEGRAADYFVGLGMTCDPRSTASKAIMTQCQVELPVWARCRPTYMFLPGTTPIPKKLQKPFAAVLKVSVYLSANTVLRTSSRVDPVPGGHRCHR